MATDARFRRLGDIVADTLVVHREPEWSPAPYGVTEPLPLPFALLPEEQRALLDFQERLPELSSARALELGDLAEPLTGTQGEESLRRLRGLAAGLLR